jgi:hypothetical protein
MPQPVVDPFCLTAADIQRLIVPGTSCLPELEAARPAVDALRRAPQTQIVLEQTQSFMEAIEQIPSLSYSDYRLFIRNGDRTKYETPYFLRRSRLAAAALRLFLGQTGLKDVVQNYVWAICEESNWVLPAHENVTVDLFSAETSFMLAEVLALLGDTLDAEVRSRVRLEIERRLFDPYLRFGRSFWWYKDRCNWNGVCNSSVAATFLLLDPEPARAARALELALAGLGVFLNTAFERDGSSNEGVAYWQYGLINFVALAEMLRARTRGAIDLLDSEHVRNIAAFPARLLLSPSRFATFSDCPDTVTFNPGIIARLAERTGEPSLVALLTPPVSADEEWRFTMRLRDILWWDGQYHEGAPVDDAYLPLGGIARLTALAGQSRPLVLTIKAGHNDENHNHNDVGSFILHVDGESLLTDPGRGLYTRQYFGPERYESIFANSYGHSVPRIGGQMQKEGREFCGQIVSVEIGKPVKRVELEFAHAYPVADLAGARRLIKLDESGTTWLQDAFRFSQTPVEVEEAFVTWFEVDARGSTAVIRGHRHDLKLTIESPAGLSFSVEKLDEQSRLNAKPGILKRICVRLPVASDTQICLRMQVV